jgi:hypothetical protein
MDAIAAAAAAVGRLTNQEPATHPKNPAAVELGRLGGKKGGPARARKLTATRRAAIARKAAKARWRRES